MSVVACFLILAAASPSPGPGFAREAPPPVSVEAVRYYAQGRLLVERGALREGLEHLYRASVFDPKSASLARQVSDLAGRIGDADSALEFADRSLELEPDHPRGLWLRGIALFRLGEVSEALALLEAALQADSSQVEYARSLARVAEQLDRIELVARAYERVVALDPYDGEAWFQLAAAHARVGHFSRAESALEHARDLTAVRPGMDFLHGWVLEGLGRPAEAIEEYRQHLDSYPRDQTTRRRLVNLLARAERYAEALPEARAVAEGDPESEDARLVLADLTVRAGRREEGLALFAQLEREAGDDAARLAPVLFSMIRHGETQRVLDRIARWSEAHPDDHRGPMLEARARALGDDPEGALRSAHRAVEMAPDTATTWVLLGTLLQENERFAEAIGVWRSVLDRFPDEEGLEMELAFCLDRSGDTAGAEAVMRAVLERRPDDPAVLNFLGYLLADRNLKLDEAAELVRRALEYEPDNGAFVDSMGWVYYRLGRLQDAREQLERAERLTGGDPIVHEHLGDVYRDLQLLDLARDQYRRSLARDGSNDRVRAKLSELR